MNLATAFAYPFKDSKWWLKALIAAICNITIIGGLATMGYGLRVVRNAAHNKPLPEWDDWGGLFIDGLRVSALGAGYALPGTLLLVLGIFMSMFLGPLGIIAVLVGGILLLLGALRSTIAYMFLVPEGGSLSDCFAFSTVSAVLKNNQGTVFLFLVFVALTNIFFNFICSVSINILLLQVIDSPEIVNYISSALLSPLVLFITAALYAQIMAKVMPGALDQEAYETESVE